MAKKIELDERVLKVQAEIDAKVEYVNELNMEKAQADALYKSKLEALKEQYDKRVEGIQGNIDYAMQEIKVLFDQVPHKSTATQEKVSVLAGDVILKKAYYDLDYDKKALLEQAQQQVQLYESSRLQLEAAIAELDNEIDAAHAVGEFDRADDVVKERNKLIEAQEALECPLGEYIKTKQVEDFDWAKFKENLVIGENESIINGLTGEVIQMPGLSIVKKPEQLLIK